MSALGTVRALRDGLKRGLPRGELLRQTHEIGNKSLLLVLGGMAFFGAVLMAHGSSQARRVVGDFSVVGPPYFELMLRELGPTFAGILAAVRLGAAISAELASMQVTEQVDALKMSAGDPLSDLVLPRLLGGLVAVPCLIIAGTTTAAVVSALVASYFYAADGGAFLDPALVTRGDLTAFCLKTLLYGLCIPAAAVWAGMRARGGAAAVGEATTKGVVWASVGVLLIDWAVSGLLNSVGL
jgi:phospholipid/cholesterol/gamma-HCH transport system permease protein